MPNPGNAPLKRFHREKGPVYLHASLERIESALGVAMRSNNGEAHYLLHGSFAGLPVAAASFLGSKPVKLPRGAMVFWPARLAEYRSEALE